MKWHENNQRWRELQDRKVTPTPHWFKNWRPDNLLDQHTLKLIDKQQDLAKHIKAKIACHLPIDNLSSSESNKGFSSPCRERNEYSEDPPTKQKLNTGTLPVYQKTMELGEKIMKSKGEIKVSSLEFQKGILDLFMESRERYPRAGVTSSEIYTMNVLALRNEKSNKRLEYKPNRILPNLKCDYKVGCLPLGLLLYSSPLLRLRLHKLYQKEFDESNKVSSPDDINGLMKRLIDTFETPLKSEWSTEHLRCLSELDEGLGGGRSRKLVDRAGGVKKRKLQ